MNRTALSALLAGAVAIAAPVAPAAPVTYTTTLSGPAESPPNDSPGTGSATVILDTDADTLHVSASFSGLTAGTIAAHIHCCTAAPFAGTAGVATQLPAFQDFPLGVTSGTYDFVFATDEALLWNPAFVTANGGSFAAAEATLAAGLDAGTTYFNIHTTEFPGGEIRGFLTRAVVAVAEPPMLSLLGVALVGVLWSARRKRQASHSMR